ncbi:MAG: hypothetical protein NW216_01430 [Hyphomicrobium sp.]|nr:hypothetical protein [Hyphomicrobium sp.]
MYEQSRRKLERQLMLRRLQWAGLAVLVAVGVAGALWLEGVDAKVEKRLVTGKVLNVGPVAGVSTAAIQTAVMVDVRLDDGREAHVMAEKSSEPKIGDHVEIAEHIHGTGRSNFSWK